MLAWMDIQRHQTRVGEKEFEWLAMYSVFSDERSTRLSHQCALRFPGGLLGRKCHDVVLVGNRTSDTQHLLLRTCQLLCPSAFKPHTDASVLPAVATLQYNERSPE